jgi:hypothetical protein
MDKTKQHVDLLLHEDHMPGIGPNISHYSIVTRRSIENWEPDQTRLPKSLIVPSESNWHCD